MQLSAIVVDVEPDPIAIARSLEDRPGFAFLHAPAVEGRVQPSFVAVDPIEASSAFFPERDGAPLGSRPGELGAAGEGRDTRRSAPRWIGVIPYEHARPLERRAWTPRPDTRPAPHVVEPTWRRYGAVVEIDPGPGIVRVVGDDARRVAALARAVAAPKARAAPRTAALAPLPDDDPAAAHVDRVRRAKALIADGDLYQVNLARRRRFAVEGRPLDLYLGMARYAPAQFGACLDLGGTAVCACSPELFLAIDPDGAVRTFPIKGTRPRGADAREDERLARELEESAKERAELTMILDVERNDLGRIAATGSVHVSRAPSVDTHPSIHHRAACVAARVRPGVTRSEVLAAMFPSGSVTGAPKVRAMEVIATLEPARRGLYTGAFGAIGIDGSVRLAMAIRVLTVQGGEGHYFAGGGIVADSDPEAELAETGWKGVPVSGLVESARARGENWSDPALER